MSTVNISHLSFLTPGNYADDAPHQGLEETLQLISLGEALGYNGAWVRQRHLEHGVSSASVFLAAATQRTQQIELGSAVIQMGFESPFRLAEDLLTVDVLAAGRLNVGLSAGTPNHVELIGDDVFHGDWRQQDFSYARLKRLQQNLSGRYFGDDETYVISPGNRQRPRVQPPSPGLKDRLWYGGHSHRSIQWAAENQFNLLIGNLTSAEVSLDYHQAQLALINTFRQHWPDQAERQPRIAAGRVIIPTDSASPATIKRYQDFAASRHQRTLEPQGPRRILFSQDIVGSSEEIVAQLINDPILREVDEFRVELPYEFSNEEYSQIIRDFIVGVAPALGWKPKAVLTPAVAEAGKSTR
ncbi:LLM class flavin-dependent oxidoreductase [Pantoea rodasii]|uniref:LLM class flavin-dependent oxidoreductase n=1 Tax=Pantoea rodasii TaxID=1076549 RepID=A0A2M9W797_9GAMM|nr:LLM class flavin-dependent oxidoreductase [Pantoea rodasii]ORM65389.1 monooxygenase [Pantoea rodasii]PJZ03378.1 LLM class flavin-dependent oxidoreductase [Pantoea rodasii]